MISNSSPSRSRNQLLSVVIAANAVLVEPPAHAESLTHEEAVVRGERPTPAAMSCDASSAPSGEQVRFIRERLEAGQSDASVWWYGWVGAYAALTVGQIVPAIALHDTTAESGQRLRANLIVGAASAAVGTALTAMAPFRARSAGSQSRWLSACDSQSLLFAAAEDEEFGRSWVPHLGGAVLSAASGMVLWLGYGYVLDGALTAVTGVLVGELQIWTQPTRAIDDAREYRTKWPVTVPAGARSSSGTRAHIGVGLQGGGLRLALTF